jgi:dihydrolipoamide dehydrogenase
MRRVREERDRFVGFVVDAVEHWPESQRLMGRARFLDDQTLEVTGSGEPVRVNARRVVIATGSSPAIPTPWREALGDRLIVNDHVFDWTTLPRSVAVIGAGVIGLEIAQALHRLGVRIRLYGRGGRVGPLTDPELQRVSATVFDRLLPLSVNTVDTDVQREGDTVVVRATTTDGQVHEERFDWLLAATGRRPNVQGLGLEHTSLAQGDGLDAQGVPRYDVRTGQAGQSTVFVAGDVGADRPLLHEAADEGRIAGDNAGRWPDVRVRPRRTPLSVVFSEPQMMIAGASHADLVESGQVFAVGEASFDDQGRSRVMARNAGMVRVYGSPEDGRFLGAEMIGPAAEHIGHLLAWSAQRGDTVQAMLDSPFYHPVIEEGLRTALRELQHELRMGPPPVERCLDCGPGA